MKILYLFILLFSFQINSIIANNSTTIFLNRGDSIQTNIIDVQSWGLIISDGRSVSHKVMTKVITNDQEVISKFKHQFPALDIIENDKLYTIKIPKKSLILNPKRDQKVIAKFYVNVFHMFNKDELFELQFIVDPKFSENLIFKVATSFGWEEEKKGNYYNATAIETSYLDLLSFGLGYKVDLNPLNIFLFLNYADKAFFDDDASAIFDNKSFLYPSIYSIIGFKRIKFILGSRYYFNYISDGKNTKKLSFQIGLGIKI